MSAARGALVARKVPREESIHEARKSVKKVRAIRQLIETDRGRGLARSAKRLRAVNRTLSCLRDADAMIETLAKLRQAHPDLFSEHVYARVRRQLMARKRDIALELAKKGAWKSAARQLARLEKLAKRWRTRHDGFAALVPGLKETYRNARRARARARDTDAASDFHEWRKTLKTLWYELRLVGGGTSAIARDIRALESAETWLGDDHNLVVLCGHLSRDTSVCRSPLDVQRLRCVTETSQRGLRRKALARTRLIFASRPRDYVRRVERAWNARRASAPHRKAA